MKLRAALLEDFRRTNPFPGRRDFNEHTIAADTCVVIKPDQFLGFGDGCFGIKREAGVNFCADHAGDDLIDLGPDANGKAVDLVRHGLLRRR